MEPCELLLESLDLHCQGRGIGGKGRTKLALGGRFFIHWGLWGLLGGALRTIKAAGSSCRFMCQHFRHDLLLEGTRRFAENGYAVLGEREKKETL